MATYRRKKKRGKKTAAQKQSAKALRFNGKKAFDQGDYDKAIVAWRRTGEISLKPALAEAHLRRGLLAHAKNGDNAALLDDLTKAKRYAPKDARVLFHLGVVQMHQGELAEARTHLQAARVHDGTFAKRVAFPLLLIGLHEGKAIQQSAEWKQISAEQRALFLQVDGFTRRPYTATRPAALRAFVAYDQSDWESAKRELNDALTEATQKQSAILHRYLGNIAATQKDWETAHHHWSEAVKRGDPSESLADNLGELLHRMAEGAMQAHAFETANTHVQSAKPFKPLDKQLNALQSRLFVEQGDNAARANDWLNAVDIWELAEETTGGTFRLAYNLALGYEQQERYLDAAQKWREVLRRRPRSANHPDALTSEKIAQLWQRSAEAYIKIGAYDEALKVYRTAIKHDADNLPLRLTYAEALMTEGRLQAAENEIGRILEHSPDHIPALMLHSEIQTQHYHFRWYSNLTRGWERVLELDPKHQEARTSLTEYHLSEAEETGWWGGIEGVRAHLDKAVEYSPNHPEALYRLGAFVMEHDGDADAAEQYLTRALDCAGKNEEQYCGVIGVWLHAKEDARVEAVYERAKAHLGTLGEAFFITILTICHTLNRDELVDVWLKRMQDAAEPNAPVLYDIGHSLVMSPMKKIARIYLEQAIAAGQKVGHAHEMLGVLDSQEGDLDSAKQHWKEAERIARRTHDKELKESVKNTRELFGNPFGSMLGRMFGSSAGPDLLKMLGNMDADSMSMPPGMMEMFMESMMGEFDDEDDDDGWF